MDAGTRPVFTGDKALGPFLATLFLVQSFLVPTPTGWNGPSWSISVEMWLYLGIALAWRWLGRSAPVLVGLAAVSALVLLTSGFEGWRTPLSPAVCHGVAGFGLGTLCWNAWEGRAGRSLVRSSQRLATVAELVLVATVVAILSMPDNPRTIIVLDLLFSAGVIVFAAQRGYISRMLCLRPFVAVGTLSYSIYLVHGVVVFYLAHLLARLGWVTLFPGKEVFFVISTPASLVDLVGLGMILASVAAAWFTWRFIERPARDWSRRRASLLGIGLEERRAPTM
jgi:peptidoglycan/LPS O-acetylase OafA/YrhL